MATRYWLGLVLGIVMLGLGAYIALRPLLGAPPVTGTRLLDMAFAALFLLRGVMNIRALLRVQRSRSQPPTVG